MSALAAAAGESQRLKPFVVSPTVAASLKRRPDTNPCLKLHHY